MLFGSFLMKSVQIIVNIFTGLLTSLTMNGTAATAPANSFLAIITSPDGKNLYAYNGGVGSSTIYQYTRDTSTGILTSLGSPIAAGSGNFSEMVVSADGKYLYANSCYSNNIYYFTRDTSTGLLTALGNIGTTPGNLQNYEGLAISPDGTSMYAVYANSNILGVFSRNTSTGTLSFLASVATNPADGDPRCAIVSPDGLFVYVTNAGSVTSGPNSISIYGRDTSTGLVGGRIDYSVPNGMYPRTMVVSPDGLFLYVVYSGNAPTNQVAQFSRNLLTGALTPLSPATVLTGGTSTSGYKIVMSTDGSMVYVGMNGGFGISQFTRDNVTGKLTLISLFNGAYSQYCLAITADGASVYSAYNTSIYEFHNTPGTGLSLIYNQVPRTIALPNAGSFYAYPKISPDGLSLYANASNYNQQLYQFSRDPSTGYLTQIGTGILATGTMNWQTSRSMAISPDGKNVYVCCHNSAAVYQYSRNTSTGALTSLGTSAAISCVSIAISNDGRFAYITNVDTNFIYTASRNTSSGALTIPLGGTATTIITSENLILSPSGTHLYVYSQAHGNIAQFSVDTSAGGIIILSPATVTAPGQPYAAVFSINGNFLYFGRSGFIDIFSVAGNGQLTFISTTTLAFPATTTYQLSMSPDGQNLYVSNTSVYIYEFSVNASTGALTSLAPAYLTTSVSNPGNCISPDGKNFYTTASDAKIYEYKRN